MALVCFLTALVAGLSLAKGLIVDTGFNGEDLAEVGLLAVLTYLTFTPPLANTGYMTAFFGLAVAGWDGTELATGFWGFAGCLAILLGGVPGRAADYYTCAG